MTVEYALSDERRQYRSAIRGFIDHHWAYADIREWINAPDGFDNTIWRSAASQLELAGIWVSDQYGGGGQDIGNLILIAEEMGRTLFFAPVVSSAVLAAAALSASKDDEAQRKYLAPLAEGRSIGTLAFGAEADGWSPRSVEVIATGNVLTGVAPFVLDAMRADFILVIANSREGPTLFASRRDARGLSITPRSGLDVTRKVGSVRFDSAPAHPVGIPGQAAATMAEVESVAHLYIAAEALGQGERALEMAVQYLKIRRQFGRLIGSFQALKHRCADVLTALDGARSAVIEAAIALESGESSERQAALSVAKLWACDAAVLAAKENIQLHGGVGVTWEHDAHLFLRRAKANQMLFGHPDFHRERLLNALNLDVTSLQEPES